MGLTDKTIVAVAKTAQSAAVELLESLLDEDSELISLYYGADATEEDAEALADEVMKNHDGLDVDIQYGGQPVYSYYISVE